MFFSLGKRSPFIYELRCEVFRYSNEDIKTGDTEIDDVEHVAGHAIQLSLAAGTGNYIINERVYQGANLASAFVIAEVKEWDNNTNKLQVYNVKGVFSPSANVTGESSMTARNLTSFDDLDDFVDNDDFDNRAIQTAANTFVDFSESNPFGMP